MRERDLAVGATVTRPARSAGASAVVSTTPCAAGGAPTPQAARRALARQRCDASGDQGAEIVRNRERSRALRATVGEQPGNLERVERVAARRLGDPHEHRSKQCHAQAVEDDPLQRGDGERAERQPAEAGVVDRHDEPGSRRVGTTRDDDAERWSMSRRTANSSAPAVGGSSHCASSTASRTGPRLVSSRRIERRAVPTRRRLGARTASVRRSATSIAFRCGGGSSARISSSTPSSRSARPAKESRASDSVGRAVTTRSPCASPRCTACCHTVVLPIPGSPTISSAASDGSASPRSSSTAANSGSRPTRTVTDGAYAAQPRR